MIPKSVQRFPACAKPWHGLVVWIDTSAGEGRSEEIMLHQPRDLSTSGIML
jgi:hypothetical protein